MAVVLALASAVVYGAADFLGGLASRRASVFGVVAVSQVVGLVALLALLPWLGGPVGPADLAWGAAAGLAGAAGLVIFFRALARGVMSVIAPGHRGHRRRRARCSSGCWAATRIGPWAAAGIALALVAVVLVSAEGGLSALRAARPASLAPALAGRCRVRLLLRAARPHVARSPGSPRWSPRGWPRSRSSWWSPSPGGSRCGSAAPALPLVALSGVGDMTANALFLLATQQDGQLAITGVLASLYPVSTVVLAQVVLRERLAGAQVAGLGAAVAAVVLITLPG